MTYPISDITRRVVYTGSLGTGPYPFTFEVLEEGDIGVYKNETLLTLTTDYTVTINADGTGSVTLISAATATDTVAIFGDKGIQRQTDFTTGGDLFANSLNDELDAQTIFAQQNAEAIVRAIRAPQFDPTSVNMVLPSASDRADAVLTFDANGDVLATPTNQLLASLIGANYVTNNATGDGSTVEFTVSTDPGSKGNIQIYIDGVYQNKSSFSISGTTVTFTEAPPLNASVEFIIGYSLGSFSNAGDVPFTQQGTGAQTRTVESKLQDVVSVKDFGAVGDGVTDDTAAIQAALDYAASSALSIKKVIIPSGEYLVNSALVLPVGSHVEGQGFLEELDKANTRLLQGSSGNDIFRFETIPGTFAGDYWHGHISNLSIQGSTSNTTGYGIHTKESDGTTDVRFSDQTVFENMTIRFMPQGGINMTDGALPLTLKNIKLLWNGGPGIKCTRISQYQGVGLYDISGDGNIDGLIYLSGMSQNDNFLISNIKSEKRELNYFGNTGAAQENVLVCHNCTDTPIHIAGGNHISSVPDGANYEKPGDFVSITGSGVLPKISWEGLSIRVRVGDTGTDPKIIGGMSTVYQPPYTVPFGVFNTDYPMFKSRLLLHRDTVFGTTPSALDRNVMIVDNATPTTITNFTDGVEGQLLFLAFNNSNTTVQDSSNIELKNGANWTASGVSTLTLIYTAGKWRELARSYNVTTGTYSVSNLTTDRAYDADSTSVAELADVLGTLISDLNTRGII